jgi:hypothetical protein
VGAWEQAAQSVLDAFGDPERARTIAREGQRYVLENFDLLRLMEEMVRMWQRRGAAAAASTRSVSHVAASI